MLVDEVIGRIGPFGEDDIINPLLGYLEAAQVETCRKREEDSVGGSALKCLQRKRRRKCVRDAGLYETGFC